MEYLITDSALYEITPQHFVIGDRYAGCETPAKAMEWMELQSPLMTHELEYLEISKERRKEQRTKNITPTMDNGKDVPF